MRLSKPQISQLARTCIQQLIDRKMIKPLLEKNKISELLEGALTEHFMEEERLNQEVREMMKSYSEQIDKGEADYNRLFQMIKQKLAKERDIIL